MLTHMKKDHGFTLVELMITLAIVAIIATVGFPGLRDLSSNNKLMTNANDIVATFHQARSEALRRSTTVTIQACKPGCDPADAGARAWTNGWRIWVDLDGDDTLDIDTDDNAAGVDADGDGNIHEQIALHDAMPADMTAGQFNTTPFATRYDYNSQGRLAITNNNAIHLCDGRTGEKGRIIDIRPVGRVSADREDCD